MAIVITGSPKNVSFTCSKCKTSFLASYPSYSFTKKGYSCSCPTCGYSAWKSK